MTKLLSASLCAALILTCPGLPAYAAVAQARVSVPAGAGSPVVLPASSRLTPLAASALTLSAPSLTPSAVTPTLPALRLSAPMSSFAPDTGLPAAPNAPAQGPAAAAAVAAPTALPAPVAQRLAATQQGVAAALDAVGAVEKAPAAQASSLGRRLEDFVTGAFSRPAAEGLSAPAQSGFVSFESHGSLAKPAGDSIRAAAEAVASDGPNVPAPPSNDNGGGNGSAPQGKGPLVPRLLASAIALLPAYFFGLPLLAAQGYLVGGLLVLSSLGMALMPFLGPDATKTLRAIPGVALGLTGLSAVGVAVSLSYGLGVPTAMSLMGPGIFAALGGWGLFRYGVSGPRHRFDKLESVGAFFGGISALSLIGVAALGPAGWLGTGVLWLSYPLSMLLWPHLPGWMGEGVKAGLSSFWHGGKGALRIVGAARRDTLLLDRLQRFSSRMYKSWKGNAVWLGLLIWGPIIIVEAVMHLAALASGLLVGLVQVPAMALWGAVHKAFPGSRASVVLAEAARLPFDNVSNGKKAWFNKVEGLLVPAANSPSALKSFPAALGIRAAQVVWLALAPFAALGLAVAGIFAGFARGGAKYDPARHDPDSLRVGRDDSFEKPSLDDDTDVPAGKVPLIAKVFTGLLALAPALYFGYPLVFEGFSLIRAGFFLAAALPLAASPFFTRKTPFFFRMLTGTALLYNGLFMLLSGHAILAGLIAALGGWGFRTYLRKLAKDDPKYFDEFEVSAFFGALGAVTALGAAWVGLAGWPLWLSLGFGALTSPFLLAHLPSWVGAGVRGVFRSLGRSIEGFHDTLSFWYDHEFRRNLSANWSYWTDKHWTHGIWLSPLWVPMWVLYAAENVLALGLGIVFGLVRAPFRAVADALYEKNYQGKTARFAKGFVNGWYESAEGNKALFDRATKGLQEAMKAKDPVSSRPTLGAALALLGARIAQVLWLAYAVLMLPLGFFYGLFTGVKALNAKPEGTN